VRWLREYFRSGWAFFVPYLASYLVYAWLRWPIHAASSAARPGFVPALSQVYWLLHGAHLLLAIVAVVGWLRNPQRLALGAPLLAWVCLAALIAVPGVYLELPADTWSHLSRLNQWGNVVTVLENTEWKKTGSFLAYSLIGWIGDPSRQLRAFDAFYLVCCLLYHWQFFRFSRALGLTGTRAFLAVLVNFLTFGNNIFGFDRYYGMSTTVFAEIAVLAGLRALIVNVASAATVEHAAPAAAGDYEWLRVAGTLAACVPLIVFNHVQGVAILGAGGFAVISWHFWNQSRRRAVVMLALFCAANALVLFTWPRHPSIDGVYRPVGWLTSWYAFDLFSPASPAFDRSLQILGFFGVVNLAAGLVLIWKRNLVGWLTLAPVLVLVCPVFTLPYLDTIARHGPPGYDYIATFHRVLLGIPAGLALCVLLPWRSRNPGAPSEHAKWRDEEGPFLAVLAASLALLLVPVPGPFFNRFWQQTMRVPADLAESHVVANAGSRAFPGQTRPPVLSTPGIGFVLNAFGDSAPIFRNKWMLYPTLSTPVDRAHYLMLAIAEHRKEGRANEVVIPSYGALFSPRSLAGIFSGHWLGSQVALEQTAGPEIEAFIASDHRLLSRRDDVSIYGSR
jgi:hypothetical protein